MKTRILIVCFCLMLQIVRADEGMWIPLLLDKQIFPAMHEAGCKLTPEQIYSANQASLKDAVIKIGGCSASFISYKGLAITNFHCVEHFVNQHSTLERNYLKQGFWASSSEYELPAKGLTAELLIDIRDVTSSIVPYISSLDSYAVMKNKIKYAQDSIIFAEQSNSNYTYTIESFYADNQFFLFRSVRYTDLRLVGFPSADIASFGGNTDNWIWPRHSADFALFRIYADSSQNPRSYNIHNVPYIPRKALQINTKGVKEGDFTMVLGYPAYTNLYATAQELQFIYDSLNPRQIAMREHRLKHIEEYMQQSDENYLQYYTTFSRLSNDYLKWQGVQYGIQHTTVIEDKRRQELAIQNWILSHDTIRKQFEFLYRDYNATYEKYVNSLVPIVFILEGLWKMDYFKHIAQYIEYVQISNTNNMIMDATKYKSYSDSYFATKALSIEQKAIPELLDYYCSQMRVEQIPPMLRLKSQSERTAIYNSLFSQSMFHDSQKIEQLHAHLISKKAKKNPQKIISLIEKDVAYMFANDLYTFLARELYPKYLQASEQFDSIQGQMMKMLLLYHANSSIPADANFTMRVSYGNVLPYSPSDAVNFHAITSEQGIIQKLASGNKDYKQNDELLSFITKANFGSYSADSLCVNFIATNHTSGGNSGSPVLDAYGRLVGVNFDRNWYGTLADYKFDVSVCRNISVDIRYILFCIEQLGNLSYIIQELELRN